MNHVIKVKMYLIWMICNKQVWNNLINKAESCANIQ